MKTRVTVLISTCVLLLVGDVLAWPRVPLALTGFTKRNIQKKELKEYMGPPPVSAEVKIDPDTGETIVRGGIDVLAVGEAWKAVKGDEDVPWMGADFLPFVGDTLCLAGQCFLVYRGAEEVIDWVEKQTDDDDDPAPVPTEPGSMKLKDVKVKGDLKGDTNGKSIELENVEVDGNLTLNSGPLPKDDD